MRRDDKEHELRLFQLLGQMMGQSQPPPPHYLCAIAEGTKQPFPPGTSDSVAGHVQIIMVSNEV